MKEGLTATAILFFGVLLVTAAACGERQATQTADQALEGQPANEMSSLDVEAAQIKRGSYLMLVGGCNDCHTPWIFDEKLGIPRPDMTRMLSGHPEDGPDPVSTLSRGDIGIIGPTFTSFAVPFGIVYSPNLTPDVDTGIGGWTEQMFLDIFRKGRHLGGNGRGVLPPMPWWWFRNFPDEDLRAMYAYLRSIPPIKNHVPSPKVPEEAIWQIRDSMDQWVTELPQEEWAAKPPAEEETPDSD